MSHYSLLVVLPPETTFAVSAGVGEDNALLSAALGRYDENNEAAISPQWDWWTIGGRWRGYFPIADGAASYDVIATEARYPSIEAESKLGMCEGGRVRALDLQRQRDDAAEKAGRDWDQYQTVVRGTAPAVPWSAFVERVEASEREILGKTWLEAVNDVYAAARASNFADAPLADDTWWSWAEAQPGFFDSAAYKAYDRASSAGVDALKANLVTAHHYDIDRARAEYGAQHRVRVVREHPAYKEWWLQSPIEEIGPWTREEFIARQRAAAVPGFAMLIVTSEDPSLEKFETQWIAKGEMGWFGMSSDTEDSTSYYQRHANALIDALNPEDILLVVDCHI